MSAPPALLRPPVLDLQPASLQPPASTTPVITTLPPLTTASPPPTQNVTVPRSPAPAPDDEEIYDAEMSAPNESLPPRHTEEGDDDDGDEGWIVAGRRLRRRTAPKVGEPASASPAASKQHQSSSNFARKVTTRLSKAARLPVQLPRGETKIILRPRGGLNVARTEAKRLMLAIFKAAGTTMQESSQDTICTNATQNVIIVSTPSDDRAKRYVQIKQLQIGNAEYETFAYVSAPDGTVKGIIRGIDTSESYQDLQANIVNAANPLALEAHRIGNTSTVIVAFDGSKVPNSVKYGAMIVKCSLYRQHHEFCRCCGKLGHRADVCPNPKTRVCLACGKREPEPNHEATCRPRCKLCGGAHATGATGCTNRFKLPHVVAQRRGERAQRQKEAAPPRKTAENFPQLQSGNAPFATLRGQRGGNLKATTSAATPMTASTRASGTLDNRRVQLHPPTEVTWAAMTSGAGTMGKPTRDGNNGLGRDSALERELQSLRRENAILRAQMERQEDTIAELCRKLEKVFEKWQPSSSPEASTPTSSPGRATLPTAARSPVRIPLEPVEDAQDDDPSATEGANVEAMHDDMEAENEPVKRRRALKSKARDDARQQYVTREELQSYQDATNRQFETLNTRLSAVEAAQAEMLSSFKARSDRIENMLAALCKKLTSRSRSTTPSPRPSP
ncbi:hypothetical protein HPB48_000339 [Haemaphysalis longicornis]|uniref:CCHC-type domain-containing protein n=1 Tax=Haemaphysalis longicornis TaxID=44386 RepID=A0A9J6GK92_HAELO|nr:hypothetical protein HPB48_000339 [Haemaphysalis longicornis]